MIKKHHGNALLVELLIVVFFFMIASTILLRVFAAARIQSDRAGLTTQALTDAQNTAERLYAFGDDAEGALRKLGFESDDEGWIRVCEGYTVRVTDEIDSRDAGTMIRYAVRADAGGEALLTLPVAVYREVAP